MKIRSKRTPEEIEWFQGFKKYFNEINARYPYNQIIWDIKFIKESFKSGEGCNSAVISLYWNQR